ncbi:MAG TPA: hypothetical protein VK432_05625 [Stellaceae bacterium]|nr:hypothetical protein [Stellaceae bacterium]
MRRGRTLRRMFVALIVIGAGGYAALNPGVVNAFYHDVYPSDPAKREALEMCFRDNHNFNRLDWGERDACYKRMLQPMGEVSPSDQPTVNLVDLQRAAAQGSMPRNDIIRLQQAVPHPPH